MDPKARRTATDILVRRCSVMFHTINSGRIASVRSPRQTLAACAYAALITARVWQDPPPGCPAACRRSQKYEIGLHWKSRKKKKKMPKMSWMMERARRMRIW